MIGLCSGDKHQCLRAKLFIPRISTYKNATTWVLSMNNWSKTRLSLINFMFFFPHFYSSYFLHVYCEQKDLLSCKVHVKIIQNNLWFDFWCLTPLQNNLYFSNNLLKILMLQLVNFLFAIKLSSDFNLWGSNIYDL